jgi:hypothetical protein
MTMALQPWQAAAKRRIAKLTGPQALEYQKRITAERMGNVGLGNPTGATIFHPAVRELTGGLNSQNINFYVVQLLQARIRKAQADARKGSIAIADTLVATSKGA